MTTDDRPFYKLLGITPLDAAKGRSTVLLADHPSLCNSRSQVHGGALYSLLDVACATASRSALPDGSGAATISLTVTYMAPGQGEVTAHGLVLRAGRTVIAVEAEARDSTGTLLAKAHGTIRAIRPRP